MQTASMGWRSVWLVVGLSWGLAMIAGCGAAPVAVEGRVSLDGEPLDEAGIQFVPLGGEGRRVAAPVRQGDYRLEASDGLVTGSYRVEFVDVPPLSGGHGDEPVKRRPFPYQYSHKSPLTVEVDPAAATDGTLRLDFDLKTTP